MHGVSTNKNKKMRKLTLTTLLIYSLIACKVDKKETVLPENFTLKKEQLLDKIKGGWAGQVIGCSYGGPTEFQFNGTMIQEYVPIPWHDNYIKTWYDNLPGLYDDVYMDLTFVDVFEKYGLDAPVDSFANAFANADYILWHANQAARYNVLNGIKAPESGHWKNNPHADDIDYQIEADYSGLMSPGMINSASEINDKIGHIMNYGDGWYGGVYVGAMYSLAFVSDDIEFVVSEALKSIPTESDYYKCMADVILWHKKYPNDWKQTWFEVERKWSAEVGCPEGVFKPFNIDAKINSAYILIGLLYGNKDYSKTIDIATRCGQDSDCNPASAAGILGTMLGYSNIPEYWMKSLKEVEDIDFKYTTISLNDVYNLSCKHALQMIEKNGGEIKDSIITIKVQKPLAVKYEKSFEGLYPVEVKKIGWTGHELKDSLVYEFEGTGVVVAGSLANERGAKTDLVYEVKIYLNDKEVAISRMPYNYVKRKYEVYWNYELTKGKHKIKLELLTKNPATTVIIKEIMVYSDSPVSYIK